MVANTNANYIAMSWSAPIFTGGTTISDYQISFDQGTNNYVILASGVTGNSYTTTISLVANTVYSFKMVTRNSFGLGTSFSTVMSVRAAKLPDAPLNLANNAVITASGVIGLTWSPGVYDGGSPVIDY